MNQPTDENSETQKIEAYKVPAHGRMGILPRHFGRHMMTFEGRVYDLMRQFATDYGGGEWSLFEISNGSMYMTPPDTEYRLNIPSNGYEGRMTADARGSRCAYSPIACCPSTAVGVSAISPSLGRIACGLG